MTVGSVIGAMTVAGIVAQERGDPPEELVAAGRRAVKLAIRGFADLGQPGPAGPAPAGDGPAAAPTDS